MPVVTKHFQGQRFYEIEELGGALVPSVSTVSGILRKQMLERWRGDRGNEIADFEAEEAAGIGNDFHAFMAAYAREEKFVETDRGRFLVDAPPDDLAPMVDAGQRWFSDNVVRVLGVELFVYSLKFRFAGRLDLHALFKHASATTIVDYKTTKNVSAVYVEHKLQLAGYRIARNEMQKEEPADGRMVVLVGKGDDAGKIRGHPFDDHLKAEQAFVSARHLFKFIHGK